MKASSILSATGGILGAAPGPPALEPGGGSAGRVARAVARPSSHRTVLVLFTYGSPGRKVVNPSVESVYDLPGSKGNLSCFGASMLFPSARVYLFFPCPPPSAPYSFPAPTGSGFPRFRLCAFLVDFPLSRIFRSHHLANTSGTPTEPSWRPIEPPRKYERNDAERRT